MSFCKKYEINDLLISIGRGHEGGFNIFLDLDQTLINSVLLEKDSNSDDEYFDFRKYKEKAKLFHFENLIIKHILCLI